MLGYLIVGLAGLIVGTLFGVGIGENAEKDKRIKYLEDEIKRNHNNYNVTLDKCSYIVGETDDE